MQSSFAGGRKVVAGVVVLMLVALLFALLFPYLQLDYLEARRGAFLAYYAEHPVQVMLIYLAVAVTCIGLALPATGVFALLAGALFGFGAGVVLCTVAGTAGATIVFLWSRYLFRDWVLDRFAQQFAVIDRGVEREGGYYLFSIRLMMVFPFFLVNLLSGITGLRLPVYVLATFLSQAIAGAVWVYAGSTLASLDASSSVLSLKTFVSLALIGLAPLIVHRLLSLLLQRAAR